MGSTCDAYLMPETIIQRHKHTASKILLQRERIGWKHTIENSTLQLRHCCAFITKNAFLIPSKLLFVSLPKKRKNKMPLAINYEDSQVTMFDSKTTQINVPHFV